MGVLAIALAFFAAIAAAREEQKALVQKTAL